MHACCLPQNINVGTNILVASENLFEFQKKKKKNNNKKQLFNNLSEFIDKVAIKFKFGRTFLQKCFQTKI